MKKIAGITLVIVALGFVVWKSIFYEMDFLPSLGLNIIGFMVMAFGLMLFKSNNEKGVQPEKITENKVVQEQKPERNLERENPDRFMPK